MSLTYKKGEKSMKVYCSIPFDQKLWEEFNSEMDSSGQIALGDKDAYLQVMPVDEFGFMADVKPVIEVVVNYSSQIALGLLINWLYEKLKQRKIDKITVDEKEYGVEDEKALEEAMLNGTKQDG